jgi:hypothetical protein
MRYRCRCFECYQKRYPFAVQILVDRDRFHNRYPLELARGGYGNAEMPPVHVKLEEPIVHLLMRPSRLSKTIIERAPLTSLPPSNIE